MKTTQTQQGVKMTASPQVICWLTKALALSQQGGECPGTQTPAYMQSLQHGHCSGSPLLHSYQQCCISLACHQRSWTLVSFSSVLAPFSESLNPTSSCNTVLYLQEDTEKVLESSWHSRVINLCSLEQPSHPQRPSQSTSS